MSDLNSKMARGVMWMALMKICVRFTGAISTVVLARLLVPADFGLVAMATSVIAFLELASAFSFDVALIQNQEAGDEHFDTAWTLNAVFKLALSVILLLLAYPVSAFFQEDRLVAVIFALAIGFFITGFENIGVVHFRKALDFRKDFFLMFGKKLVSLFVTIPLAFLLRNYWALVIGIVAGNCLGVFLTFWAHPYRPKLSLAVRKEMLSFSKWLLLNNVVNYFRHRSPDFIIGRISGMSALGLFSVGYEIATLPTTEIVAPINRVVFPGYAQLASSMDKLRNSYLDVLELIAVTTLPAGLGISVVAAPLVEVFLGDQWSAAAPIVQLLAIYGAANALQTNSSSVFNAIGKPHIVTWTGTVNVVVLVILAIIMATRSGPIGVAFAYVATSIALAPLTFIYICRETSLTSRDIFRVLWRPIASSTAMMFGITWLKQYLLSHTGLATAALLGVLVAAGACLYVVSSVVLWYVAGRPESADIRLLRKVIPGFGR